MCEVVSCFCFFHPTITPFVFPSPCLSNDRFFAPLPALMILQFISPAIDLSFDALTALVTASAAWVVTEKATIVRLVL